MRVVLDNSVTMGWVRAEQATPYADSLLDGLSRYEALAPALWSLEFGNALLVLHRRRKLTDTQRQAALARAESWGIRIDAEAPSMAAIIKLALDHDLTGYDAAYLDCALRHHARLATQDTALKKAAKKLDCWYEPKNH